jgi:hypothetical protein
MTEHEPTLSDQELDDRLEEALRACIDRLPVSDLFKALMLRALYPEEDSHIKRLREMLPKNPLYAREQIRLGGSDRVRDLLRDLVPRELTLSEAREHIGLVAMHNALWNAKTAPLPKRSEWYYGDYVPYGDVGRGRCTLYEFLYRLGEEVPRDEPNRVLTAADILFLGSEDDVLLVLRAGLSREYSNMLEAGHPKEETLDEPDSISHLESSVQFGEEQFRLYEEWKRGLNAEDLYVFESYYERHVDDAVVAANLGRREDAVRKRRSRLGQELKRHLSA